MRLPKLRFSQTYRYLRSKFSLRSLRKGKYIHQIALVVTNRCNARCLMCHSWQAEPESEFSLEDLKRFLGVSSLPYLNNFSLTGGDPYLREDLVEIARLIHNYYPRIAFFVPTNGLYPEEIVAKAGAINGFAPTIVCISMDGLGAVHDNIRGSKDAFINLMETINQLKKRENKPILSWSFTIIPENYNQIREVFEFSKKYTEGINISFRPAGVGFYFNTTPDDAIVLTAKQRQQVIKQLEQINQEYKNFWVEYVIQFMKTARKPFPCQAGIYSCVIMPDFDVYPCTHCPESWRMGNLRDYQYSLNKLIASDEAQNILRTKVRECNACVNEIEGFATIVCGSKGLVSSLCADAKILLSKLLKKRQ